MPMENIQNYFYMDIPGGVHIFHLNLSDWKRVRLAQCPFAIIIVGDLGSPEYMM